MCVLNTVKRISHICSIANDIRNGVHLIWQLLQDSPSHQMKITAK